MRHDPETWAADQADALAELLDPPLSAPLFPDFNAARQATSYRDAYGTPCDEHCTDPACPDYWIHGDRTGEPQGIDAFLDRPISFSTGHTDLSTYVWHNPVTVEPLGLSLADLDAAQLRIEEGLRVRTEPNVARILRVTDT